MKVLFAGVLETGEPGRPIKIADNTISRTMAIFFSAMCLLLSGSAPGWTQSGIHPVLERSVSLEKSGNFKEALQVWTHAEPDFEKWLYLQRTGWLFYLDGDFENGLLNYDLARSLNREDFLSGLGAIDCLAASGRSVQAGELCAELQSLYPDNADIKGRFALPSLDSETLAQYLTVIGYYLEALPLQREICRQRPEDAPEIEKLGFLHLILGHYGAAIDSYTRAFETSKRVDPLIGLARTFLAKQDFNGLRATAEKILSLFPGDYFGSYYLGMAHLGTDDYIKAREQFEKFPLDPSCLCGLAQILEIFGDRSGARGFYEKALAIDPSSAEAKERLANLGLSLRGRRVKQEISDARAAADLAGSAGFAAGFAGRNGSASGFLETANAAAVAGDRKKALDSCRAGLDSFPGDYLLCLNAGFHSYLLGSYDESLMFYDRAFKVRPQEDDPVAGRAKCLAALGRYTEALPLFEELLKKFPENTEIRGFLSLCLYELGRFKEQIGLSRANPGDLALDSTRGWSLLGQGKFSTARRHFTALLKKTKPDAPTVPGISAGLARATEAGAFRLGYFDTFIGYRSALPSKRVGNAMASYAPNRWLSTRFIHGRTTLHDGSFTEETYDFGLSWQFGQRFSLGLDWMTFENDDPLSDGGSALSLQLGHRFGERCWVTLETDLTLFNGLRVTQFSPRVDWSPRDKWWLQLKGYTFASAGFNSVPGDGGAVKFTVRRYIGTDWSLSGHAWSGEKRFSFESDKVYSFNTYDVYTGGYGFELGFTARRHLEATVLFSSQSFEPFAAQGTKGRADQLSLGIKSRF